jgi:Metallo-beta-lactamase superfamily
MTGVRVMAKEKSAKPKHRGPHVTIRMYCQGLGDCFLLNFVTDEDKEPVRVLIDCGVLQHTPGEAPKMRQVAADLSKETGGHIDLLVVTHEHWDHVAGFSHAQNVFKDFTFGRVWLSWAENADDPDAQAVKADLGKKKKKVAAALKAVGARLKAAADQRSAEFLERDMEAVETLLGFYGPADSSTSVALAAAPKAGKKAKKSAEHAMTLGDTMDWLRAKVRPGDWCSPGERRPLPGAAGVNVYVLGPPRSVAGIRKMDPTGDQGYRLKAERDSLLGAIDWLTGETEEAAGPFGAPYRVPTVDARTDPFFREMYGFADDPLGDAGQPWRRIDDEWLGGISRLALQLDTGVNNTSLALAFELPDGRALIFPGDAQIGNWLSWDDVKFKTPAGEPVRVTAKDLLHRAVFYKVGHHGSHNATRKVGGLEEMTGGELVAMIPTDEKFALKQSPPHGWKMPFSKLYAALKTRTRFRILRADRGEEELAPPDGDVAPSLWDTFTGRVTFSGDMLERDASEKAAKDQPLYVEYTIPI